MTATDDLDPTNDPLVKGHEEGTQAPFPPVWDGDTTPGHHKSCAVRVKGKCTCGMAMVEEAKRILQAGKALMPLAGEYLHQLLHLPADVHIVGALWDGLNVTLALEAFSTNEFPSGRVTARFHEDWNVKTGRRDVIFDGWESID